MAEDRLPIWRVHKTAYGSLSLPPIHTQGPGKGRFDCPASPVDYRVLYCAGTIQAAYIEALQRFRLNLTGIREVSESSPVGVPERDDLRDSLLAPIGYIQSDFVESNKVCTAEVSLHTSILRISSSRVIERIRHELTDELIDLGLDDLDLSEITRVEREVTQRISLWAWQHDYAGISYVSRFGADLVCYALFEDRYSLTTEPVCEPVKRSEHLLEAADTLRLHLPR